MGLFLDVANISGGVLLGLTTLDEWDGEANFFNKIANVLMPFQSVIGGVLFTLGFLSVFSGGNLLFSIASITGGFLLFIHLLLYLIPNLEAFLKKMSNLLITFKAIIGIGIIIIGILGILKIL